ncbi:MAG: cation transporter [Proteobacteria bacterium]|nr:cation transporter [Pseudomonadota bacterium]
MKKMMLMGLAVLAICGGGVALALGTSTPDGRSAQVAAAAERQATFAIENMTCATCPITIRKAMEGVAGVSAVSVDFAAKTARVTYDPRRTNAARIAAASTNAGYPARAVGN